MNGKVLGPYDSIIVKDKPAQRGIWDFRFAGDYFAYRAKVGEKMVACRGQIQRSRHYAGHEQALRLDRFGNTSTDGRKDRRDRRVICSHSLRRKARERKAFAKFPATSRSAIRPGSIIAPGTLRALPAKPGEMVYVGGDTQWNVVVGEKQWPGCGAFGPADGVPIRRDLGLHGEDRRQVSCDGQWRCGQSL